MTDPRLSAAMKEYQRRTPRSAALFAEASQWSPLGVHSNYRYLEPYPFYVRRAKGVTLWDVDDHAYLDFNMGFGGLASGHAHPKIVEAVAEQLQRGMLYGYEWEETPALAERICRRYSMAQVRFSSTGLEATHHAIRIARGYTGRRTVIKFEGSYHGSHDTLLVGVKPRAESAGPARRPHRTPAGPGVIEEATARTVVAPFNDLEATTEIAQEHREDLAAILVEPIPMNMGHVMPEPGFLAGLRELADGLDALLLFDEVKTGAKYPRGAAGRFGVHPDILLLGKSIACGAPLSAIAAGRGILERVGPRKIPHAGTFNANPVSMACCRATLDHVLTEENLARAARLNGRLAEGYRQILTAHHVVHQLSADGPSGTVFFSEKPVRDWRSFLGVDGERSMLYYYLGLNRELIPSGTGPDEQWTVSVVHTDADVDRHLELLESFADQLTGAPRAGEIEESV